MLTKLKLGNDNSHRKQSEMMRKPHTGKLSLGGGF